MSFRVNVKLHGMLSRSFDHYEHLSGPEAVLPNGASIHDMLVYLNLTSVCLGMIYMDGMRPNKNSRQKDGALIKSFQPFAVG